MRKQLAGILVDLGFITSTSNRYIDQNSGKFMCLKACVFRKLRQGIVITSVQKLLHLVTLVFNMLELQSLVGKAITSRNSQVG